MASFLLGLLTENPTTHEEIRDGAAAEKFGELKCVDPENREDGAEDEILDGVDDESDGKEENHAGGEGSEARRGVVAMGMGLGLRMRRPAADGGVSHGTRYL